jgi:hypothetical protein
VADEEDERGADACGHVEVRRDEGEPAQVRQHGGQHGAVSIDASLGASLYSLRVGEETAILKRLYSTERLTRLAEELLANPCFAQAFTLAIQKGLETKGRLDRNIQTVLGLLNLPSRADLARLVTKLEVLQGSLVNINIKLDRLLAEREPPRRRARKSSDGLPSED